MKLDHSSLCAHINLGERDLDRLGIVPPTRLDYDPITTDFSNDRMNAIILGTYRPFADSSWYLDSDVLSMIQRQLQIKYGNRKAEEIVNSFKIE